VLSEEDIVSSAEGSGARAERSFRRSVVTIVGLAVLAALVWLASGAVTLGALQSDRLWPLWWVGGAAIPAVTVVLIMRRAAGDAGLREGVLRAAAFGGVIAIVVAAPLNRLLIGPDALQNANTIWWVGLTEEGAKLGAALLMSYGVAKTARNGLFLGAAVGFGFSVWENAGYIYDQMASGGALRSGADWAGGALFMAERGLLGIALHPLFAGIVGCAVFAAIHRPTARRIVVAALTFVAIGAAHASFDWLLSTVFDTDDLFLGVPVGDWFTFVVSLALVGVWLLILRRLRRAHRAVPVVENAASDGEGRGVPRSDPM
jgi:RsiW-degrading membrane proteinase PrsW (M82 family)